QAEASKFQYIIGWTIFKLTKSNTLTLAYEKFAKIKLCLNALSSEQVEYIYDTRSKTTIVIPGADFIQFIYYLESLIHQLFEKHIEYGPDILIYINNNLVNNLPLKKQFSDLLHVAYEFYYNDNSIQLSKEAEDYLLNVKAMNADLKNNTKQNVKPKMKLVTFKKEMLPDNLDLALGQLKIWAQNNVAKSVFEKTFTISNLKILIQAFQDKPVKIKEKKKSALIDLLFNYLNNAQSSMKKQRRKVNFLLEIIKYYS
ncbi:19451_t:CDS:2, partial [Dentiscutata erythropus]